MPKKIDLHCYNCESVILSVSTWEILRLNGLSFRCECCGHENHLVKGQFTKAIHSPDPYGNIFSYESILDSDLFTPTQQKTS